MPRNLFEHVDARFRYLEQPEPPRKKEPPKPRWTEAEIARINRWIEKRVRMVMAAHLAEIERAVGRVEFTKGPDDHCFPIWVTSEFVAAGQRRSLWSHFIGKRIEHDWDGHLDDGVI
jgi:hypothetical protein